MNGGGFDKTTKSIIKIKTRLLRKIMSYKVALVAIEMALTVKLVAAQPTKTNNVSIN